MRLTTLLLPLALAACFERAHPVAERVVRPIQVVRVALQPARASHAYAGVIRPRHEADIGFKVAGRIASRGVDVGRVVAVGDVLARLDPTDLTLQLASARADLSGAQASAAQSVAEANRSRSLSGAGWTSISENDQKQATARAGTERVASARAALSLAQRRVDDAVLRAPAAGVVTAIMLDPGTVVSEGTPVLRLADAGAMEAEVALPESAIATAATGRATVAAWTRPADLLPAALREMSPTADVRLRTYNARFAIANPPPWLVQGMSATVTLIDVAEAEAPPVASLPLAALADRGAGQIVWVVDPGHGTLEARPVTVAALREDIALVRGVRDGELVVSLGVQTLDPAAAVRVAAIQPVME